MKQAKKLFSIKKDTMLLCACISALSAVGGLWLGANATLARPLDGVTAPETGFVAPAKIEGGDEDIARFFLTYQCEVPFTFVEAVKDESLGRRYYHVRVAPQDVVTLRNQVAAGWKWGKIGRAVYLNDINSRLPRSRNLPGWWKKFDIDDADHVMLDSGGVARWYAVFADSGDACLMWTGK